MKGRYNEVVPLKYRGACSMRYWLFSVAKFNPSLKLLTSYSEIPFSKWLETLRMNVVIF